MQTQQTDAVRPRYELLDGLRGVAALMVICYHIGECFATSPMDQWFNHGYLAVDFFFVLSGFVIGHAYDGRWRQGMTAGDFMRRRLIRLHPMVVAGVVLGVVSFLIQGCEKWDGTSVSYTAVGLSLLLGLLMLPSLPGTLPEVRGNGEMFPLNGPSWSLFFEYIGSIFYALFLHRLSTRWLKVFVVLSGAALAAVALGNGSGYYHVGVGWTAADGGFVMGLVRMTFSFSAGMLLWRVFKPVKIRGAFWICSALIVAVLAVPYVGGTDSGIGQDRRPPFGAHVRVSRSDLLSDVCDPISVYVSSLRLGVEKRLRRRLRVACRRCDSRGCSGARPGVRALL